MKGKLQQQDSVPEQEKKSIQKTLQEIPDDILLSVLADRIRGAPDAGIKEADRAVAISSQRFFSGPLPPPEVLAKYQSIDPNISSYIVKTAERQQTHVHTLEKDAIKAAINTESKGQTYALVVSLAIILGSMFLIYSGKEISGSILAGSTLIGLAYVFITGRKKDQ